MSLSVGDKEPDVLENRKYFFNSLGLKIEQVKLQKQIHSDIVMVVDHNYTFGESDALITNLKDVALAVSAADCVPIFLYDNINKVIAAVHSGWRGTEQKILYKTLIKMMNDFLCMPENIYAFIGPCISQRNYEVSPEVAGRFDNEFVKNADGRFYLDLKSANKKMLTGSGIPEKNIEVSQLCTFEQNEFLHSYRREGEKSGRALGVLCMRGNRV